MRHKSFILCCFTALVSLFILSCEKKKSTGIAPEYGTTGNPNPGQQTVTGSTTYTNPATNNSSLLVGGSGWSNPTCGSTNSLVLKGVNDETEVTISFASLAVTGTYNIATNPGPNTCAVLVKDPANQPAGISWYGKTGMVVVNTTSASITASLVNVACTQLNFAFPSVRLEGSLTCGQ